MLRCPDGYNRRMTDTELAALTSAAHEAFKSMSAADIHRMLTDQNASALEDMSAMLA